LCLLLLGLIQFSYAQNLKILLHAADSTYKAGNFAASASLYESAARTEPANGLIHYYAARAFALAENNERAWLFLRQSVDRGWHQVRIIQKDQALAKLHSDPRWGDILKRAQVVEQKFAPIDSLIQHLNVLSANAYMYRVRLKAMGGGDKSYKGYAIPVTLESTPYGSFDARVLHADTIFFTATSTLAKGTVATRMDATGRLGIGGWTYTDEFKKLIDQFQR
jgi:hypothetical protein